MDLGDGGTVPLFITWRKEKKRCVCVGGGGGGRQVACTKGVRT